MPEPICTSSASSAGDEYQFYPEGYNPSGTSSSVAHSSGVALNTGSVRVPAEPDALVARYRTFGTSNTSKLNTSKYQGFRIIFR